MTKESVQELINKYRLMFNEVNINWDSSREVEHSILDSILTELVDLRNSIEEEEEDYTLGYINGQY